MGTKRSRDTSLGYFLDERLVPCAASMAWVQNPCCKRKIPLCEEQALPLFVYKKIEEKNLMFSYNHACQSVYILAVLAVGMAFYLLVQY